MSKFQLTRSKREWWWVGGVQPWDRLGLWTWGARKLRAFCLLSQRLPSPSQPSSHGGKRGHSWGPTGDPGDVSADPCVLHHPWIDQRRQAGQFCRKTAAPLKHVMKVGTGLAQNEASARLDKCQSRGLSIICVFSFVACYASFFWFYFCKILMRA